MGLGIVVGHVAELADLLGVSEEPGLPAVAIDGGSGGGRLRWGKGNCG